MLFFDNVQLLTTQIIAVRNVDFTIAQNLRPSLTG